MTNLETMNTIIEASDINFNSPNNYEIKNKTTGELIQKINIQKGAVKDSGINGVFIEDLILICINQLEYFQMSEFVCKENEATLGHLRDALAITRARQYERMLRGVQGKNIK